MRTPRQLSEALKDSRLDKVSKVTGIHPNTLRLLRDNPNSNPTWRTISALNEYLDKRENAVGASK